jgi:hypothetical protein
MKTRIYSNILMIYFINQLQCTILYSITICLLHYYPRHVSGINMPIFRSKDCIHTASGIFALCKRLHSTQVDSGLICRLISNPIHAPSHELEDTDTNTPPTKVISKRIFVELLGIREECVILCLWGMNPLA